MELIDHLGFGSDNVPQASSKPLPQLTRARRMDRVKSPPA
jgi:hypothetical protein